MKSFKNVSAIAYIGIGANLGQPKASVLAAISRLTGDETSVRQKAHLYRSPPMGPQDQPDFINTVVEIQTELRPSALLDFIKSIEKDLGRTKTSHWGPRVIDLDLLLYNDVILKSENLQIPHPHLHSRRFVLEPLAELAPNLVIPGLGQTVSALQTLLEDPAIHQIA